MKQMPVSDWADFQQLVGEYQLLYCPSDPDLALFVKSAAGAGLDQVYITGPRLEVIERLSPEGWRDSPAPSGEGVMLLIGTEGAWRHLGVTRQSPEGA